MTQTTRDGKPISKEQFKRSKALRHYTEDFKKWEDSLFEDEC